MLHQIAEHNQFSVIIFKLNDAMYDVQQEVTLARLSTALLKWIASTLGTCTMYYVVKTELLLVIVLPGTTNVKCKL